jgi:ribosome maturation factor RimP
MIEREKIIHLVEQSLEQSDKFLVDIRVKTDNRIYIYIDSDSSITVDDCIMTSKFVEKHLDRDEEDFELVVSSAGIDQPYKNLRQYIKNIGRPVSVTLMDGVKLTGMLLEANHQFIVIKPETAKKTKKKYEESVHHIPFDQIKETIGIVTFKNNRL